MIIISKIARILTKHTDENIRSRDLLTLKHGRISTQDEKVTIMRFNIGNKLNSAALIEGYSAWLYEHICRGWDPYYTNIMFEPLLSNGGGLVLKMHRTIGRFYGRLCSEFHRRPRSAGAREYLPRFWLFPDRPVFKHEKQSLREVTINGGLHFNGPVLLPPTSRFKECPIKHFQDNQHVYARDGIARIHATPITGGIYDIVDYAAKTLKHRLADWDDVLILPRPASELSGNGIGEIDPEARAIRDLVSRLNVSEEVARTLLPITKRHSG